MAKLCLDCQSRKPDTSVRGTCQAVTHIPNVQLPQKHQPWTDGANFTLCDACAEHYGLCAWCWGPLDGRGRVTVPTTKKFCRAFEQDNGTTIEGMYVGEQIVAQFNIDMFSGVTWDTRRTSWGVQHVATRIVPQGRMATLEMYFDLNRADPALEIELVQVTRSWWVSLANAKTWKIKVEVKQ